MSVKLYNNKKKEKNMSKFVYLFAEGNASMRNLLGGKGANLAEMTSLGLPVPHGFTVTTEACTKYYDDGKTLSQEVIDQIKNIEDMNKKYAKRYDQFYEKFCSIDDGNASKRAVEAVFK